METEHTATVSTVIHAPASEVWNTLTDPDMIREFMYGTEVITDWEVGSSIIWQGTWEGKPYSDKGIILDVEQNHMIKMTHYSPISGEIDRPENYHTLTYVLTPKDGGTELTLTQHGSQSEEEADHSEQMWGAMLKEIKVVVEK